MKKHKSHLGYYLSLAAILLVGLMLVVQLHSKPEQAFAVVMLTFFYVAWGMLHHLLHHNMNTKIMIEYSIIGSLGMTIILFLLQTGI